MCRYVSVFSSQSLTCLFVFLMVSLKEKVFNFDEIQIIDVFLLRFMLFVSYLRICLFQNHKDLLPTSLPPPPSAFMFKSMIHFEFVFQCGGTLRIQITFVFAYGYSIVRTPYVEKTILPTEN